MKAFLIVCLAGWMSVTCWADEYTQYLPEYVAKLASACELPDLTSDQQLLCKDCRMQADQTFEVDCQQAFDDVIDAADGLWASQVFPEVAQRIAHRDWENAEIEKHNCRVRIVHQCFVSGQ